MLRCGGVAEPGHDATQVQLHPLMLWAWRATTAMSIRCPVVAGSADVLELEDPRVVLIIGVLVGDQLHTTPRIRAHERGSWLLPDQRPVVRVADPEGLHLWLMSKTSMPLQRLMSACLHTI